MKILVGIVLTIFFAFMGSVFVYGFLQKQSKEAAVSNIPAQTQPANSTDKTTKAFTSSDVAAHNKPSSCWLIIHGNVYDVTNFLDIHPGGADVIIPYCGKDATQPFETQDRSRGTHSQSARDLLAQYQIGVLQ
jgi:cytochrome b involved in lipid metabolism